MYFVIYLKQRRLKLFAALYIVDTVIVVVVVVHV